VSLATIMWLVDDRGYDWWTRPFVIYGMNPILAFVGSGVLARLIYSILTVQYHGKSIALQTWMYEAGYASWLEPKNASLAFALTVVLFWYGIVYLMYRKNIFLKV
jgi:predicted acyltransferase